MVLPLPLGPRMAVSSCSRKAREKSCKTGGPPGIGKGHLAQGQNLGPRWGGRPRPPPLGASPVKEGGKAESAWDGLPTPGAGPGPPPPPG